jgi:Domain of unknown function (DUF5666)
LNETIYFVVNGEMMKTITRFSILGVLSLAAIFLAACNAALPAGAKANISADGKSAQVEFTGTVESIAADQWVVSGQKLSISAQTVIDGAIAVGDTVKVHATVTSDGVVNVNKIESVSKEAANSETDNPESTISPQFTPQSTPGAINPHDEKDFFGVVELIGANSWQVSGQVFIINPQSEIQGNIQVGDKVKVHFLNNGDGTFTATEIGLVDNQSQDSNGENHPNTLQLTGKVEAFAPDSWTVKGQVFAINTQTQIKDNILLGDVVKVHYVVNTDGTFTATEIELAGNNQAHNSEKKLTGVLQELTPTQATIDGVVVLITPQTVLDSGMVIGVMVKADVVTNADGTVTALKINTFDNSKFGQGDHGGSGGTDGGGGFEGGSDGQHHGTPGPGGHHNGHD